MGHPAGFKPNIPIAHFLGKAALDLIEAWNYITAPLTPLKAFVGYLVAFCGLCGFTVQISLLNDLLFFFSSWLFAEYSIFALIYKQSLLLMSDLYKLFRGKKFNTVRQKDGEASFSVSELYLGVLLMTLTFFLVPTIAVFYFYAFMQIILKLLCL